MAYPTILRKGVEVGQTGGCGQLAAGNHRLVVDTSCVNSLTTETCLARPGYEVGVIPARLAKLKHLTLYMTLTYMCMFSIDLYVFVQYGIVCQ